MRVSREKVGEQRDRMVAAAGRLLLQRGFDGVTVGEAMKSIGRTHGAFYAYFASKDDLAKAACEVLVRPGPSVKSADTLADYVKLYLSPDHRDRVADDCPFASLGAEAVRQAPEIRHVLSEGLRDAIDRLAQIAPGDGPTERRRAAVGAWSTMVGTLILARLTEDPQLSQEILEVNRGTIVPTG